MKKAFAITVSVLLVCLLCSCRTAENQEAPSNPINETVDNTTVSEETTAPTEETSSQNEDACDHLWGQWVEKTKATCQTGGVKERTCRNLYRQRPDRRQPLFGL